MKLLLYSSRGPVCASRHGSKGQALVEFALTVPLLLIIMLGSLEIGFLINGHIMLANAVREGTRAASLGQTLPNVNARIINLSGRLNVTGSNITTQKSSDNGTTWVTMTIPSGGGSGTETSTSYNSAEAGNLIRITVQVPYQQITNFIPGLNGINITKTVVMRREPT